MPLIGAAARSSSCSGRRGARAGVPATPVGPGSSATRSSPLRPHRPAPRRRRPSPRHPGSARRSSSQASSTAPWTACSSTPTPRSRRRATACSTPRLGRSTVSASTSSRIRLHGRYRRSPPGPCSSCGSAGRSSCTWVGAHARGWVAHPRERCSPRSRVRRRSSPPSTLLDAAGWLIVRRGEDPFLAEDEPLSDGTRRSDAGAPVALVAGRVGRRAGPRLGVGRSVPRPLARPAGPVARAGEPDMGRRRPL